MPAACNLHHIIMACNAISPTEVTWRARCGLRCDAAHIGHLGGLEQNFGTFLDSISALWACSGYPLVSYHDAPSLCNSQGTPPPSRCTQISSNNIKHLCGWAEHNRSSCQLSAPQLTVVQRVPAVARRRSII